MCSCRVVDVCSFMYNIMLQETKVRVERKTDLCMIAAHEYKIPAIVHLSKIMADFKMGKKYRDIVCYKKCLLHKYEKKQHIH